MEADGRLVIAVPAAAWARKVTARLLPKRGTHQGFMFRGCSCLLKGSRSLVGWVRHKAVGWPLRSCTGASPLLRDRRWGGHHIWRGRARCGSRSSLGLRLTASLESQAAPAFSTASSRGEPARKCHVKSGRWITPTRAGGSVCAAPAAPLFLPGRSLFQRWLQLLEGLTRSSAGSRQGSCTGGDQVAQVLATLWKCWPSNTLDALLDSAPSGASGSQVGCAGTPQPGQL